ncbi:TetR/AcrR family transcriptional regulator [Filimonas effusa]|uniref:TetR/AcrR family transcriptional regulator n=1 Tax=Filimonas effusa TaxID=2508721 RepID=A0A4Q1D5T1_9BACT|nr:TetR/AcrR family transcriptional regulator [Filimonas effusa]RXK83758.1 TetR/AcrR family transcriptional regulator [Filimonas effusa]
MKHKELQGQRMRGYFLEATKELLKSEGLQSISVRSIADKAGYSYATMYSYFKDVNDLVFLCVQSFYEECKQEVRQSLRKKEKGIKSLKAAIRAYADYFIQYPGIFELFFLERTGGSKEQKEIAQLISASLDTICEEDWNHCLSKGVIEAATIEQLKTQVRYTVYGLLLLYLNRKTPASYTEFISTLTRQVDTILDGTAKAIPAPPAESGSTVQNALIAINVKKVNKHE